MKLKQALVLGATVAVLAIPALAADEAIHATSQPSAAVTTDQKVVTPAKKETFHKKGHKNCITTDNAEAKKMDENTDLSKLDTINPGEAAKN